VRTVGVVTAAPEDVTRAISQPGTIQGIEEATLFARATGYLKGVYVDKGDRVRAGQLLALIDSAELGAQRDQASAAYQESRADVAGATAQRRRAEAAVDESAAVVNRARADVTQGGAAIEQARAELARTEAQRPRLEALVREAEATAEQTAEEQQRAQFEIARWQQEEVAAQAAVRAAQSGVEKAESDARLQETTFKRYKAVQDKDAGLIAAQQVDEARARMEASRAEVDVSRGRLDTARRQAATIGPQIEGARRGAAAAARKLDAAKSRIDAARNELQVHQREIESAKQLVAVARSKADSAVHQVTVAQSQNRAAAAQTRVVDTQITAARAQSQGMRSALQNAAALADYRRVVAPFDGVVTERLADAGQLVQSSASGQTGARGIVKVVRDNSLRVMIPVPEADTAFVRRGAAAELHVDAYPKETFRGTVTRFSGAVDPRSRTLLTEIQLPNPGGKLRPGMYVRVRLTLEVHRGALTVPSEAVMGKDDRSVWRVVDGKAKKTPVTVGVDTGKTAEITSGLQAGDTVVVVGRDSLTEGVQVKTEPADVAGKK